MSLSDTLNTDLKEAVKAKDTLKTSTLRLLLSALQYAQIAAKKDALNDEEVLTIIQKQVKQRKESIETYAKGGRDELKAKEEAESAILEAYLPQQLSDEELTLLIDEILQETGATSKKDMGLVMKEVMTRARGQADGKRVSALVSSRLS